MSALTLPVLSGGLAPLVRGRGRITQGIVAISSVPHHPKYPRRGWENRLVLFEGRLVDCYESYGAESGLEVTPQYTIRRHLPSACTRTNQGHSRTVAGIRNGSCSPRARPKTRRSPGLCLIGLDHILLQVKMIAEVLSIAPVPLNGLSSSDARR